MMNETIDDVKVRYMELYDKHNDLKQQLADAERVIEFYGGESNWIYGVEITQEDHDISEETREGFVKEQGGRIARKYKEKYKLL